jgi:hypothetical protein
MVAAQASAQAVDLPAGAATQPADLHMRGGVTALVVGVAEVMRGALRCTR